ncbi:MAG TPA: acetyl-CoA carboxylase biotin carboxyl carrier protein [Desulfitobacterium dehalogenans]|uniref:Biotin carboxyl carrier protein of acetyl-CoA carboxylase n=1 Tax=Desulfitobacterium dehalogenans TaxID=36854 RepID=A0A7C7D8B5_9FIRM|nr:acetyl-CoA carboxylase biotin carboxyl carrier protein [Desulfitobacterium dehalogenans]
MKEIQELIRMIGANEIAELNLQIEGIRINIKKAGVYVPAATTEAKPEEKGSPSANTNLIPVVAPLVGTFYRAPAPDAPPYVEVGVTVKVGQPVCIVEALKLKNEIEAEVAGKIVEILVENGQAVVYGQTLFLIEKQ